MMNQVTNIIKSIQQFWNSRNKKTKTVFISVLSIVVVISIIVALMLNYTKYTVLYTGLDATEQTEILSEISSMNIGAQVQANGTILVPSDQENQIRMNLATMGYPKSGFSYDIWTSNVNMFTTDSQNREIVKMQLQERIQATLETFEGINKAYVTLTIPVKSNTVISTNQSQASASVVVHLNSGVTLNADKIKGITLIVAKAVPDLSEENVSITDGTGRLLVADNSSDTNSIALENERMVYKKSFETQLTNEVLKLLTPSYGIDGLNVSVNAVFDYDKKITDDTTYTPSVGNNGMIDHQDTTEEWGKDDASGGVVGVEDNTDITYDTEDEDDDSNKSWSSSSSSTSYLVNTLKQQTEKNGVYVEKVTVSVLIYASSISQEEKDTIISTVANATGTTMELISVGNLPLLDDKPVDIPANENQIFAIGLTYQQFILAAIGFGVAIVFVVILMIAILGGSRNKNKKKSKKKGAALSQEEMIEQQAIEIKKISDKPPETKEAAIRREISSFTKNSPEIAAQLLKSWIREDGE